MKIGVIGAGISGLLAARLLSRDHDVQVYDGREQYGGNAQTITVQDQGQAVAVDVGACMFSPVGYPHFFKLLDILGVSTAEMRLRLRLTLQPSGTEYSIDLNHPLLSALRMLRQEDTRQVCRDLWVCFRELQWRRGKVGGELSLGEYLESRGFSEDTCSIVTGMAMAIWTVESDSALQFPAHFVFSTLKDIGIWRIGWPSHWRRISGGAHRYLEVLTEPIRERISLGVRVAQVRRERDRVILVFDDHREANFDEVIFAISAETALALIDNPSLAERTTLSAFDSTKHAIGITEDETVVAPYRNGSESAFMHVDSLPLPGSGITKVDLKAGFFDLRRLLDLQVSKPLFLWYMQPDKPRPENLLASFEYTTPVFSAQAFAAQAEHGKVSGVNRLHFCGAGWGNGLHEGGVVSALNVTKYFGKSLDDIAKG